MSYYKPELMEYSIEMYLIGIRWGLTLSILIFLTFYGGSTAYKLLKEAR